MKGLLTAIALCATGALAACSNEGNLNPTQGAAETKPETAAATEIVKTVYAAFAAGDMETFKSLMSPDIVWMEAEGNPYTDLNPYIGPEAVLTDLIGRLVSEWEDFSVTPEDYMTEGARVVAFGRYRQTWKATGKRIDIPFVHVWTIENGKITAFQQYTDTATLAATMAE